MAQVIRYIDPDATGLGNGLTLADAYTSIYDWDTTEYPLAVPTDDHIVYIASTLGTVLTDTGINIRYWDVNTVTMKAYSGYEAVTDGWSTNAVQWIVNSTNSPLRNRGHNVTIDGLQIRNTGSGPCLQGEIEGVDTPELYVKNCRLETTTVGSATASLSGTMYVENSIAVGGIGNTSKGFWWSSGSLGGSVYNSIVIGPFSDGVESDGPDVVSKNIAVINCTQNFDSISTIDYCASDGSEGTNHVTISDWTAEFEDYLNGDFTLKNTGDLYQAGIGPSIDTDVPVLDMSGNTRSGAISDIGVAEYISIKYFYIDPDVAIPGDGLSWATAYASIQAWNIAEQKDLVSSKEKVHAYCRSSAGTADTTTVDFNSNWTTSNTYNITVEAFSTNRAKATGWDDTIYRHVSSANPGFRVIQDHVKLIGLQLINTNRRTLQVVANGCLIDSCRVVSDNTYPSGGVIESSGVGLHTTIVNNIVHGTLTNYVYKSGILIDNGTSDIYNNTVDMGNEDPGTAGTGIFSSNDSVSVINNNAVLGTDLHISWAGASTLSHNAIDYDWGAGSIIVTDWDNEFPNRATFDYTPTNTGQIYLAGLGPAADPVVPILGMSENTRSGLTATIGANEYAQSSAYSLEVDPGSFNLTGSDINLIKGFNITLDSGSFEILGSDLDLTAGFIMSPESGSFILIGSEVTLTITGYILEAESGVFTIEGQDVELIYSGDFRPEIVPTSGQITLELPTSGAITQNITTSGDLG